jgi:tetratricopeptide (TPR) repeat protein
MTLRLNAKLLAWALGSAAALVLAVHFLHAFQSRRGARDLLPLADEAEQRGNPAEAAHFLGNYLSLAPGDADVRARCGALLARLPSPVSRGRALEMFAEVVRQQPGRDDVRRQLVRLALDLGRFDDAEPHLAVLLRSAPDDGELNLARGRCQEARRDDAPAARSFTRAIEHDPHQVDAYVRLARLLRLRLNRPVQADQVMEDLVKANDRSVPAYLGRGRYRQEFGSLDHAAEDLKRAEELAPGEADVLLAAAGLARARGDDAEARRRLQRCRELHPQDLRPFLDLGALEVAAGRRPEAVAALRQGLEARPDQPELLFALAEVLLDQGDFAGGSAVISRLGQVGCSVEQGQYLQARLLLLEGRWTDATGLLEWVRARAPSADLLVQVELALGSCYDQLDDPDRQTAAYRRAVESDPRSPTPRLALAGALAAQGRADEAAGEYYEALSLPGAPASGWVDLAGLLCRHNLGLPPGKRGWQEVERVLARAEQAAPGSREVLVLRARVRLAQGRPGEARQVLATDRNRPELAAGLADIAEVQGRWEDAAHILDEAGRRLGDRVELRLARAVYWARRGTPEAPARLAEVARDWEKLPAADQVRLLRGLGEIYAAAGDHRAAGRVWAQLAELQPGDLRVRLLLFDQAVREDDRPAAERWLADLQRIEGAGGPHYGYAEAVRALGRARHGDRSGVAQARRLLDAAGARRQTWARVPLLAAQLDETEGKGRDAVSHYLRAIELGESDPGVVRRAAQLLSMYGRDAEARRLLSRLPQ